MLRMNLATKPFYNERTVHLCLGVIGALGLALLVSGGLKMASLARHSTEMGIRTDQAARVRAELTGSTKELQKEMAPGVLDSLADATREANELIDRRVFSWTAFFNRLESTLPADVMVTELRPEIDDGAVSVSMGVVGRDLNAISDFVVSLEGSGAFSEVLNRQAELMDDGMYRAMIRGRYFQAASGSLEPPRQEEGAETAGLGTGVADESRAAETVLVPETTAPASVRAGEKQR